MSKCPREQYVKKDEKKMEVEGEKSEDVTEIEGFKTAKELLDEGRKVVVLDRDMLQMVYSKGRKYYLRLRRCNNGTGVDKPYADFCKQIGITQEEADKLFYAYLKKKYGNLVELIKRYN